MQHIYRLAAAFTCVSVVGACQGHLAVPAAAQTGTSGVTLFPDRDVASGVDAFKSAFAKLGMVGVGRDVTACQRSVAQGAPGDLTRQCFAFEMTAMISTVAHDNRMHSAPLPDMSQTDFKRRFAGYCQHLGTPPAQCGAATDALFRQVYPRTGA